MKRPKVSFGLVVKLASVIAHYQELASPSGDAMDKEAAEGLMKDPEVVECFESLGQLGLLPVKR